MPILCNSTIVSDMNRATKQNRTIYRKVRLSPDEDAELQHVMRTHGLDVSKTIRRLISEESRRILREAAA